MTNVSLQFFPGLKEFMEENKAAITVSEANKYLTTNQILNISNDIAYSDDLNEKIVYDLLKLNNYELIDVGNDTKCWAIKCIS